jgi:hypothetical protein
MHKYFNPLISDPSGIDWWKKYKGWKSRETVPLEVTVRKPYEYIVLILIYIFTEERIQIFEEKLSFNGG